MSSALATRVSTMTWLTPTSRSPFSSSSTSLAGRFAARPRRQVSERREHLGREHRMPMRQDEYRRAEAQALRHAGDERERREGLEEVRGGRERKIAGRVVGIARADLERNDDVVARPHGIEAERFRATRETEQRVPRRRGPPHGQVVPEPETHSP